MMKNTILYALMFLMCATVGTASAQGNINEIVFASEQWQNATNADGSGLYWDIFRAVYEPAGIKVSFVIRSYAGAVKMVQMNKADALVGSYKDEVEGALFPEQHYDTDVVTALFKKGSVSQWQGEQSLAGKKCSWIKGYAYDEYLSVPVVKNEFDERKDALRILDMSRVDFYLDAQVDMEDALQQGYIDPQKYDMQTVLKLNLYLAFANTPKGTKLKEIFDERFPILLQSGEIKKLFDKWQFNYNF